MKNKVCLSLMKLSFGLALLAMPLMLCAQQLHFSKQQQEGTVSLKFAWQDMNDTSQQLNFSENSDSFFKPFRNFRAYNPQSVQQAIVKKTLKAWQAAPIDGVSVKLTRDNGQLGIGLTATSEQALQDASLHLKSLSDEAKEHYLAQRFYHLFTRHDGKQGVKPDHIKIAEQSAPLLKALKPIILETVELRNIRLVTDYTLNFIQSIPYSELASRQTSAGAGFVPPMQLLYQNQGDCDSKVTLTSALLRSLMPRIEMIMVFIDGHALMGINAPLQAGDKTISFEGITYVLGEPTGPAQYPLGKIAIQSEQAIDAGLYTIEKFHVHDEEDGMQNL